MKTIIVTGGSRGIGKSLKNFKVLLRYGIADTTIPYTICIWTAISGTVIGLSKDLDWNSLWIIAEWSFFFDCVKGRGISRCLAKSGHNIILTYNSNIDAANENKAFIEENFSDRV